MNLRFVWKIPIASPPERVWRYIADTNRVNQYAGLPEFTFRYIPENDGGSRQVGETRYMGWRLQWDEHPFEWIEGQQFEIVRDYRNGPVRRFRTTVVLHRTEKGSMVEQTVICEPRWAIAIPAIYWEIGFTSRRKFEAAYRKIESFLHGESDVPLEPFPRQAIPPGRLDAIRQRMANAAGREWLPRLIDALESMADEDLDHMQPFVFADRWKADRREVLKLFLSASQAGLLNLSWDVICPSCRGTPERYQHLKNLRLEAHCPACNIEYDANFAESVEVAFRPNPAIRKVEVVRYCSGGPMNAPHVVVQQRIPGRQSRTLELHLTPWRYHVRSLKLQSETFLQVRNEKDAGKTTAATIKIHRPTLEPETLELGPQMSLTLENNDDHEITVMIERVAGNENAATAAMVIAMAEFRTLFSEEVLAPETPISVGAVALLFTDLKASTMLYEQFGEAPAYGLVRRHFALLKDCISASNGALIKTIGDSVMAAFVDPAKAVEAAFAMHRSINNDNASRGDPSLNLKIGIHHGSCFAVNMNEIIDYFGTAVNVAARIQKESVGNDIVITEDLWADAEVQKVLAQNPHRHEVSEVCLRGLSGNRTIHRIHPEVKI